MRIEKSMQTLLGIISECSKRINRVLSMHIIEFTLYFASMRVVGYIPVQPATWRINNMNIELDSQQQIALHDIVNLTANSMNISAYYSF